jgi:hypothetical protein
MSYTGQTWYFIGGLLKKRSCLSCKTLIVIPVFNSVSQLEDVWRNGRMDILWTKANGMEMFPFWHNTTTWKSTQGVETTVLRSLAFRTKWALLLDRSAHGETGPAKTRVDDASVPESVCWQGERSLHPTGKYKCCVLQQRVTNSRWFCRVEREMTWWF